MINFILKNLFILYLGASLRFLFHRFIKQNKQITYYDILHGIEKERTKEDEIFNAKNEFINRIYAYGFLLIVVIIIVILS